MGRDQWHSTILAVEMTVLQEQAAGREGIASGTVAAIAIPTVPSQVLTSTDPGRFLEYRVPHGATFIRPGPSTQGFNSVSLGRALAIVANRHAGKSIRLIELLGGAGNVKHLGQQPLANDEQGGNQTDQEKRRDQGPLGSQNGAVVILPQPLQQTRSLRLACFVPILKRTTTSAVFFGMAHGTLLWTTYIMPAREGVLRISRHYNDRRVSPCAIRLHPLIAVPIGGRRAGWGSYAEEFSSGVGTSATVLG